VRRYRLASGWCTHIHFGSVQLLPTSSAPPAFLGQWRSSDPIILALGGTLLIFHNGVMTRVNIYLVALAILLNIRYYRYLLRTISLYHPARLRLLDLLDGNTIMGMISAKNILEK